MDTADWLFAFASVRGAGHLTDDTPCQDACRVEVFDGFGIAVVCDGAGSARHSDWGAQHVADSGIFQLKQLMEEHQWHHTQPFPQADVWQKYARQLMLNLRNDLENFALNKDIPFRELACTVITTVWCDKGLLCAHIGDGRAGWRDNSKKWNALICPFRGELANETVFITSDWSGNNDHAFTDRFVRGHVVEQNVNAFCLLSDGCEKASFSCNLYDEQTGVFYDPNLPYPAFFDPNVKALRQLHEQKMSQEQVNQLWASFLKSGNERLLREPDDKTMVLVVRNTALDL